jgi:tetratricopeptide (TPR) repeat protein
MVRGEGLHLLKCAPLLFVVGWLAFGELSESIFAPQDHDSQEAALVAQFERQQNIAAAVPGNLNAQCAAATSLAKYGWQQEALDLLHKVLKSHPTCAGAQLISGDIHRARNELDQAAACYEATCANAETRIERVAANHDLGELYLQQKQVELAKSKFRAALQEDPGHEPSRDALRSLEGG